MMNDKALNKAAQYLSKYKETGSTRVVGSATTRKAAAKKAAPPPSSTRYRWEDEESDDDGWRPPKQGGSTFSSVPVSHPKSAPGLYERSHFDLGDDSMGSSKMSSEESQWSASPEAPKSAGVSSRRDPVLERASSFTTSRVPAKAQSKSQNKSIYGKASKFDDSDSFSASMGSQSLNTDDELNPFKEEKKSTLTRTTSSVMDARAKPDVRGARTSASTFITAVGSGSTSLDESMTSSIPGGRAEHTGWNNTQTSQVSEGPTGWGDTARTGTFGGSSFGGMKFAADLSVSDDDGVSSYQPTEYSMSMPDETSPAKPTAKPTTTAFPAKTTTTPATTTDFPAKTTTTPATTTDFPAKTTAATASSPSVPPTTGSSFLSTPSAPVTTTATAAAAAAATPPTTTTTTTPAAHTALAASLSHAGARPSAASTHITRAGSAPSVSSGILQSQPLSKTISLPAQAKPVVVRFADNEDEGELDEALDDESVMSESIGSTPRQVPPSIPKKVSIKAAPSFDLSVESLDESVKSHSHEHDDTADKSQNYSMSFFEDESVDEADSDTKQPTNDDTKQQPATATVPKSSKIAEAEALSSSFESSLSLEAKPQAPTRQAHAPRPQVVTHEMSVQADLAYEGSRIVADDFLAQRRQWLHENQAWVHEPQLVAPSIIDAQRVQGIVDSNPLAEATRQFYHQQVIAIQEKMQKVRMQAASIYTTQRPFQYTTYASHLKFVEENRPPTLTMAEAKALVRSNHPRLFT